MKPDHRWIAQKVGLSIPGVSLLRSGKRSPSRSVMSSIEFIFGWTAVDQFQALQAGNWAAEFDRVTEKAYEEQS
jgi:hypothetical protein